jgi:Flp pilus assembly protein TadG
MTSSTMSKAARRMNQSAFWRIAGRLVLDRRGISAAHFALFLPIVLGTVMGISDLGGMLLAQNTIVHAANEATRFAMVRSASTSYAASKDQIVSLVQGSLNGLDEAQAVISVDWIPENKPGAHVTVNVEYPYALSALGFGTINLNGSASTLITH